MNDFCRFCDEVAGIGIVPFDFNSRVNCCPVQTDIASHGCYVYNTIGRNCKTDISHSFIITFMIHAPYNKRWYDVTYP